MRDKRACRDLRMSQIASRQHGVVTSAQLFDAGLNSDAIRRRVDAGRLHRVHRGVYSVGHTALVYEGRCIAAVFACGPRAVLSHRSAASLWALLPTASGPIDVTVPGLGGRRRRRDIRIRRSQTLSSNQLSVRNGIAVTSPARTLDDLRRACPARLVRKAMREAAVLGLDVPPDSDIGLTRSELEFRFLKLCRRHRLPAPEVNVRVGPFVVDFLWHQSGVVVETDGYRFHRGPEAFEQDRARDVELRLQGYEVVRFTYRMVTQEPDRVARTLRRLLRAKAP